MSDFLANYYPWIKSLHIISVISWMAGLLYLPRLFVHHVERGPVGSQVSEVFKIMEVKLLRMIMNPAMIATWIFGVSLAFTPGILDWSAGYPYVKLTMVLAMTWFHHWLANRRKEFARDSNTRSAKTYRLMNEIPTVIMIVIVVMIVVRPF